jgi:GNAT superfamily N-acetyltransferase
MTIVTSDDPAWIVSVLDRQLAADPISATVLGSVRAHIAAEPESSIWAATGTAGVAARSSSNLPVVLAGGWDEPDLSALARLLDDLPSLVGMSGPRVLVQQLAAALGRPVARVEPRRLYRLDELIVPTATAGSARAAGAGDIGLVGAWYRAFSLELDGPDQGGGLGHHGADDGLIRRVMANGQVVLWVADGAVVSMAVRQPAVAGSARIGPVYTPPEHRGHGYAAAVTAQATSQILALSAVPVLFTDADNALTNRLYPRLGYYAVQDHAQLTLG